MDANLYWYHARQIFSTVTFAALPKCVPLISRYLAEWPPPCLYPGEGETLMNWDTIEGNWKQVKGKAREQWGKLTDSDWDQIAGKKEQLVGRIQERYGISKDEAQKQADAWARAQNAEVMREEPTVRR
jgi:uncharacterized protein YjbJ (UPF0337 family)